MGRHTFTGGVSQMMSFSFALNASVRQETPLPRVRFNWLPPVNRFSFSVTDAARKKTYAVGSATPRER
jgi:hypothetical protein